MRHVIIVLIALFSGHAALAAECPVLRETGAPQLTGAAAHTTIVCHAGYAALEDNDLLVPRWVAYRLFATRTMGCLRPAGDFHAEETLPAGRRAEPEDYRRSGFDRGHLAPAEDFAFDAALLSDSYSMANVVPQLPGLNREGWERLEQTVRAWAWTRGDLAIFSGPVFTEQVRTIGNGRIGVPSAFFKVIVDPEARDAIGFLMPQRYVAKGNLARWVVSIAEIEAKTGLAFPLPDGVDRQARPLMWPAAPGAWYRSRQQVCQALRQMPEIPAVAH
ncbi:MAG: DNA/RNA non-specific endonuclease [Telmatospirillum sp.]|nr:DNA/RNA non-specific endonuclease [Telmatospirillum sp.]